MDSGTYTNATKVNTPPERIVITSVVQPQVGAIIMSRCPDCRVTEIDVSVYAKKPERGDLWKFEWYCGKHYIQRGFPFDPIRPLTWNGEYV